MMLGTRNGFRARWREGEKPCVLAKQIGAGTTYETILVVICSVYLLVGEL